MVFPTLLGKQTTATATRVSARTLAQRERKLDLLQAQLDKSRAETPPKLPPIPKFAPVQIPAVPIRYVISAALPAEVVYVRHEKKHKEKNKHEGDHKDKRKHDEHKGKHDEEHAGDQVTPPGDQVTPPGDQVIP